MKNLNKRLVSLAASIVLATSMQADCTYELFSISSAKGTTIGEYVDQLTSACEYSLAVADSETEKLMDKKLNKTHIKNLTIDEVFEILLTENNLNFTIENDILRISYLKTITYNIDYILSQRKSTGSTDVMLSSSSASIGGQSAQGGAMGGAGAMGGQDAGMEQDLQSGSNKSGISIEHTDEVKFWEELDLELQRVLNRPEDAYQAEAPIINKNAGLITISATGRQQARIDGYLKLLQEKIQRQVLIDVSMMAVLFDDKSSTGVDWSQLYGLTNFEVAIDSVSTNGKWSGTYEPQGNINEITSLANRAATMVQISGGGSLNEVIKFLKEQGEVRALSNPKIMTLNNQPALITVGTEYFYTIESASNSASAGGNFTTQNNQINSVFAGVLLDITPEIGENETITLKVNPSLSQTRVPISSDTDEQENRTMPPDLDRRQLSAVVTVKDGNRVILGGLIGSRENFKTNKVPLLGDIPGLGYFFKYEEKIRNVEELVIVIEPHIIKPEGNTLSIADLGYTSVTKEEAGLKATFSEDDNVTSDIDEVPESKEADEEL